VEVQKENGIMAQAMVTSPPKPQPPGREMNNQNAHHRMVRNMSIRIRTMCHHSKIPGNNVIATVSAAENGSKQNKLSPEQYTCLENE